MSIVESNSNSHALHFVSFLSFLSVQFGHSIVWPSLSIRTDDEDEEVFDVVFSNVRGFGV